MGIISFSINPSLHAYTQYQISNQESFTERWFPCSQFSLIWNPRNHNLKIMPLYAIAISALSILISTHWLYNLKDKWCDTMKSSYVLRIIALIFGKWKIKITCKGNTQVRFLVSALNSNVPALKLNMQNLIADCHVAHQFIKLFKSACREK